MASFNEDAILAAHPNPVPPSPPPSVSVAGALLWALAALHAGVAVVFVLNRGDAAAALIAQQPDLPEAAVAGLAFTRVVGGAVLNGVLAAVLMWLGVMIRGPRQWAQWLATAACALGVAGGILWAASVAELMPSAQFGLSVERQVSMALDVIVIALLWLPRAARRFFGGEAA